MDNLQTGSRWFGYRIVIHEDKGRIIAEAHHLQRLESPWVGRGPTEEDAMRNLGENRQQRLAQEAFDRQYGGNCSQLFPYVVRH